MTNLSIIELENESLRHRLKEITAAAAAVSRKIDAYVRQECLRSDLIQTNQTLKDKLK